MILSGWLFDLFFLSRLLYLFFLGRLFDFLGGWISSLLFDDLIDLFLCALSGNWLLFLVSLLRRSLLLGTLFLDWGFLLLHLLLNEL